MDMIINKDLLNMTTTVDNLTADSQVEVLKDYIKDKYIKTARAVETAEFALATSGVASLWGASACAAQLLSDNVNESNMSVCLGLAALGVVGGVASAIVSHIKKKQLINLKNQKEYINNIGREIAKLESGRDIVENGGSFDSVKKAIMPIGYWCNAKDSEMFCDK